MGLCDDSQPGDNVVLAFALSAAAGLATTVGSVVPLLVNKAKTKYLAAALSFAAGMLIPLHT